MACFVVEVSLLESVGGARLQSAKEILNVRKQSSDNSVEKSVVSPTAHRVSTLSDVTYLTALVTESNKHSATECSKN